MRDGRTRRLDTVASDPSFEQWLARWKATVVVLSGSAAGTEYEIDAPSVSLGRSAILWSFRTTKSAGFDRDHLVGRTERTLQRPLLFKSGTRETHGPCGRR